MHPVHSPPEDANKEKHHGIQHVCDRPSCMCMYDEIGVPYAL